MAPTQYCSAAVDSLALNKIQQEVRLCKDRSPANDGFLGGIALTLQLLGPMIKSYDLTHPSTIPTKKSRNSASATPSTRADASTSSSSSAPHHHHPTSTTTLPTSPAADSLAATLAPLRSLLNRRNPHSFPPESLLHQARIMHDEMHQDYHEALSDAEECEKRYEELKEKIRTFLEVHAEDFGVRWPSEEDGEGEGEDCDDGYDWRDHYEDVKPVLNDYSSSDEDPTSSSSPAELPTPRLSRERLVPTRLFAPFLPSNSHASTSTSTSTAASAPPFWLKGHQPAPPPAAEDSEDDVPARKKSKSKTKGKGKGKGKGGPRVVQEVEVDQRTVQERMADLVQDRQRAAARAEQIKANDLEIARLKERNASREEERHEREMREMREQAGGRELTREATSEVAGEVQEGLREFNAKRERREMERRNKEAEEEMEEEKEEGKGRRRSKRLRVA